MTVSIKSLQATLLYLYTILDALHHKTVPISCQKLDSIKIGYTILINYFVLELEMSDIFISYSRQDSEFVHKLHDALDKKQLEI